MSTPNKQQLTQAAILTAAVATGASNAQAQTLDNVERVLISTNTVSVDMGTTIMQGDMIPTISVAGATENVAGKVIYGENGENKYAVGTMGLSGAQWYAQANGASSREEGLTGYSIGGKVGYVTDAGTNLYMHGGHTRVNGVDYGTKTWQTQSSSMNVQTSSQSLGTRTEDDPTNNVRKTIEDIRHTTTQAINTTTTTHSVHSGRHGSRTNGVSIGTEINTGNVRPVLELGYDRLKFDDNTRKDSFTGKIGVIHYTSTGHNYLNASHTTHGGTSIEAGVRYKVNDNTSINAFASHNFKNNNNTIGVGVTHTFGGSKSAPTPKPIIPTNYGPTTSSDYMVKGVLIDTNLHNNGLYNLPNKTKHFEDNSVASSTTTDVQMSHRDESKIIKTENLAPTISYDTIEQTEKGSNNKYEYSHFDISDLVHNGWEVQEVGEVITQNGEIRKNARDIDTTTGIFVFYPYTIDASWNKRTTLTTYSAQVRYIHKTTKAVKVVTYKYSFYGRQ